LGISRNLDSRSGARGLAAHVNDVGAFVEHTKRVFYRSAAIEM
jgi:hypothetical protein